MRTDHNPLREDELRDQVTNLIREFLLTVRSLTDWCLERLDERPREPEVEDIPIE